MLAAKGDGLSSKKEVLRKAFQEARVRSQIKILTYTKCEHRINRDVDIDYFINTHTLCNNHRVS